MAEKTVRALRGAICASNTEESITAQTVKLYDEILKRNNLDEADIVSLFFSLTADLRALNPASALRRSGRAADLAMMVFQEAEAAVPGIPVMGGIIRLLAHVYMEGSGVAHVYLDGAENLRPDRGTKNTVEPKTLDK